MLHVGPSVVYIDALYSQFFHHIKQVKVCNNHHCLHLHVHFINTEIRRNQQSTRIHKQYLTRYLVNTQHTLLLTINYRMIYDISSSLGTLYLQSIDEGRETSMHLEGSHVKIGDEVHDAYGTRHKLLKAKATQMIRIVQT